MKRRRKVSPRFDEPAVTWIGAVAVGCEIHPFRLVRNAPPERGRQRHTVAPTEVADRVVPRYFTVSKRDQKPVNALVVEPVFDLLVDPWRRRCLWRSKQDQKARLFKRLLDRGPKTWRRREARIVTKDAQSPPPVPRLAELLYDRLQSGGNRFIPGMTIRNEGVVDHLTFPSGARRTI